MSQTVLLVAPTPDRFQDLARLLRDEGIAVITTASFQEARARLCCPLADLLVTPVRLGPFNGIQLAMRCRADHPQMRSIVTDVRLDTVLQRDAAAGGAVYVVEPVDPSQLLALAHDLLRPRPLLPAAPAGDPPRTRRPGYDG